MVDFKQTINLIRQNNGFKPNKREDSFYRTYTIQNNRPIQVRISNHGTHLWTWYDKDYDPSYAINICVVFSKDGSHSSDTTVDTWIKDEQGNVIGERKPFEVKQFVYNCQILDENDAGLINAEIQNTWKNGGFNDPLAGTPKHANVVLLKTNQDTDNDNTDIKTENIMKNKRTYRLTENKLRGVIREAVKSALRENEDDFTPHGYMGKSNWGGTEVQISDNGDSARFRDNYGDGPGQPTDWLEIQFDEDGVAYVETPNGVERLDMYMRY